jgi:tetrahydromethanopterin S-methyltransferase subunit G
VTDAEGPRRRSTDREISLIDKRLGFIERDVEKVVKEQLPSLVTKLDGIRDALAEPEASPVGRSLIGRAATNAANIERLRQEVGEIEDRVERHEAWRNEMVGAAKFGRLIQLILGIVVALLALIEVSGARAP